MKISLLISILIFASGCNFEKSAKPAKETEVEWSVSPKPARVGPIIVTLKIKDPSGRPLKATLINVEGNMTHPGMVPLYTKALEVKRGVYTANMNLNMPGDWKLLFDIKLSDGSVVQKSLDLSGVK